MIIFAVTTNVEFVRKAEWLNSFFTKHNKAKYDFHVTLKQPCVIEEDQVIKIKNILDRYFKQENPNQINITFDTLNSEASVDELSRNDASIMIEASNEEIAKLQHGIIGALSNYRNYLAEETRSYEENFRPHITIATNLNREEFESAKGDIRSDIACQAKITKVILTIVRDFKENTEQHEEFTYNLH